MSSLADLVDALESDAGAAALRDLDERRRLTTLIPELEAGRGFQQPELHYYDVLDHNLAAVAAFDAATGRGADGIELRQAIAWVDLEESLSRRVDGLSLRAVTRLACLLHDVAKPRSATHIDGKLRFPRHGPLGAEMMSDRLPEIGLRPEATDIIARLIRYHLRPAELVRSWPPTDRAVRRFVNDLGGHVLPLMLVNLSDGMATRGPGYTRENFRRHCTFINYVLARAWAANEAGDPPLLSGDDLIRELDLQSGRLLGAILTSLRRAQSDGAITDRMRRLRTPATSLRPFQRTNPDFPTSPGRSSPWRSCGALSSTQSRLLLPSTSSSSGLFCSHRGSSEKPCSRCRSVTRWSPLAASSPR